MNKTEILKELQALYNHLTQDPEQWAETENEKLKKAGYWHKMESHDFYAHEVGRAEEALEYILKKCGVMDK